MVGYWSANYTGTFWTSTGAPQRSGLSFTDVRSTDLQEPHPSPSWASNANAMDSINSPPPDKDPLANQIRS
jgi:hypothetical protein